MVRSTPALPLIALAAAWLAASAAPARAQNQTPQLTIDDVTVPNEGNSGATLVTFTVTFVDASVVRGQVSVFYSTVNGTATGASSCGTPGADYVSENNMMVTLGPSRTRESITINVCGDQIKEDDETFFVNLFQASGAEIQKGQGRATIRDDEPQLTLRVNDTRVTEGGPNAVANMVFTVTLSGASSREVSVTASTANRTATGGTCGTAGVDYANTSTRVTFAATTSPGEQRRNVNVPVCGDGIREGDETLELRLSTENGASVQRRIGTGTITDDEALPTVNIANAQPVYEPSSSAEVLTHSGAVFTVTLAGPPTVQRVIVNYATQNGTAVGGTSCGFDNRLTGARAGDFIIRSDTLHIAPGVTQREVRIGICRDFDQEPTETFSVLLSNPVNARAGTMNGTGTILHR